MINILIFFLTLAVLFYAWYFYSKTKSIKVIIIRFTLLAFLFAPFNINGNIYTVFGNGVSQKNFNSIFSFYQKAEKNSFSVLSIGYQEAKEDAFAGFVIFNLQRSKKSKTILSLLSVQKNIETKESSINIAENYQDAGVEAFAGVGILNFQKSKKATTVISLLSLQDSKYYSKAILGIPAYQKSKKASVFYFGLGFIQIGEKCSTPLALSLYQKEAGESKSFCIFGGME